MELAELKKQNEAEAAALAAEATKETVAPVVDPIVEEPEVQEPELDADGNPIEPKPAVEPWMEESEPEPGTLPDVPVSTHIKKVQKLKGKVSAAMDENEALKARIAALEAGIKTPAQPQTLKRPLIEEFDTDEEYHAALDKYDDARADDRASRRDLTRTQTETVKQALEKRQEAVTKHYLAADALIEKSGINPEVYKKADTIVRETVESVLRGKGDIVTDIMIELLGEGSEKVMYNLGVNKTAQLELADLLRNDPTGMRAAVWLGHKKATLTNPKKGTSQAPAPASILQGDATGNAKSTAFKKKYDAIHSKGGDGATQKAYNVKKEAKKAGVDTSSW